MRFDSAIDILGLRSDEFTAAELLRHYRQAALLHHPDRHADDPTALERFIEVQRAYNLLTLHASDATTRLSPITKPIRVRCVAMGKDLVGSLAIDPRRVRRNGWIPLVVWAARTCPFCAGAGELEARRAPLVSLAGKHFFRRAVHAVCQSCEGMGVQAVERSLRVRTPSLRSGIALRLRGGGLSDATGSPGIEASRVGDVVLHLR